MPKCAQIPILRQVVWTGGVESWNSFQITKKIQLVQTLKRNFSTQNQTEVIKASEWLADLSLV